MIKKQLLKNEYQCDYCLYTYTKEWSDEEAEAEAEQIFGKHPNDWRDKKCIVCDSCFKMMNPLNNPDLLKKVKKYL